MTSAPLPVTSIQLLVAGDQDFYHSCLATMLPMPVKWLPQPTPMVPNYTLSSATSLSPSPSVLPAAFPVSSYQETTFSKVQMNMISILVSSLESLEHRTIECRDVSITLKASGIHLFKTLTVWEFLYTFEILSIEVCVALLANQLCSTLFLHCPPLLPFLILITPAPGFLDSLSRLLEDILSLILGENKSAITLMTEVDETYHTKISTFIVPAMRPTPLLPGHKNPKNKPAVSTPLKWLLKYWSTPISVSAWRK